MCVVVFFVLLVVLEYDSRQTLPFIPHRIDDVEDTEHEKKMRKKNIRRQKHPEFCFDKGLKQNKKGGNEKKKNEFDFLIWYNEVTSYRRKLKASV
jgi:hypothetical protein